MRKVLEAVKSHVTKPDINKWKPFEKEITMNLGSASKQEYIEIAKHVADVQIGSKELWDQIQKEYVKRYDHFNIEDSRALVFAFWDCQHDLNKDVADRLNTTIEYIGKKDVQRLREQDPEEFNKISAASVAALHDILGYIPSKQEDLPINPVTNRKIEAIDPEDVDLEMLLKTYNKLKAEEDEAASGKISEKTSKK